MVAAWGRLAALGTTAQPREPPGGGGPWAGRAAVRPGGSFSAGIECFTPSCDSTSGLTPSLMWRPCHPATENGAVHHASLPMQPRRAIRHCRC